jgi:hypothetical protein
MKAQGLRRPSPLEADLNRPKKSRILGEVAPASTVSSLPPEGKSFFFGEYFARSCGGTSFEDSNQLDLDGHNNNDAASSSSGSCLFGIRFDGTKTTSSRMAIVGKEDDDPATVIARAMNDLSLQERDQAYEDLHGVSAAVQETPELFSQTLSQMEHSLRLIRHKPAYDMADAFRDDYVQVPQLRIMFLRAERFHAEKAAQRMVAFLDWKLRLFGEAKLCQWHVGLDDLDPDAQFLMESGWLQTLPARDSRGRVVVSIASNYYLKLHRNNRSTLQSMYYVTQCAAEDEATQKNGLIYIAYSLKEQETYVKADTRSISMECSSLTNCLPLRHDATHFCASPGVLQYSLTMVAKSVGLLNKARLRVHFGTHTEILYSLLSFGLPSSLVPFTEDSALKTDKHKKWMQRRIIKEQELARQSGTGNATSGVFSGIDLPHPNDVLLGKGKPFQTHPGNQRLLELARAYLTEYDQANPNGGRNAVVRKIMLEVLHPTNGGAAPNHNNKGRSSGRFLQRRDDKLKSGWWEEVTDEQIMMVKVSHALRGIRKRNHSLAEREGIIRTTTTRPTICKRDNF